MNKDSAHDKIIHYFPSVVAAFAYGSAVISQAGYSASNSLIDYIFVVKDPLEWHRQNRLLHPHHYQVPARWDRWLQGQGASIYYIPNVTVEQFSQLTRIKYGVISKEDFCDDLLNWRYLYVAGRLHKPVQTLKSTPFVESTIIDNRKHALGVALLTIPEEFSVSWSQVLRQIVGISFWGDWRMAIGAEDPRKIDRILVGQYELLSTIYNPLLTEWEAAGQLSRSSSHSDDPVIFLNRSPMAYLTALCQLPHHLLKVMRHHHGHDPFLLAKQPAQISNAVKQAAASIVRKTSFTQPVMGLFTAGLGKSLCYVGAKLRKGLLSIRCL